MSRKIFYSFLSINGGVDHLFTLCVACRRICATQICLGIAKAKTD